MRDLDHQVVSKAGAGRMMGRNRRCEIAREAQGWEVGLDSPLEVPVRESTAFVLAERFEKSGDRAPESQKTDGYMEITVKGVRMEN
jgi:hypothetical protein